jgi:hypothetical protein
MTRLNAKEAQGLLDALDDEYKSWSTYDQVIHDFGEIRPFINIVDAEQRHIDALLGLCAHYDVLPPPNRWPGQVPRYASVREACEHAIGGEIENAALYDRVLQSTDREDIVRVYLALQSASTDRHLPAFRRCAGRR